MFAKAVIVALAAGAATAQVQNYTSSLEMHINPNQVPLETRAQWCVAQSNSCVQLCDKNAPTNDCKAATLEYKCICGSNSSAPALQYYQQTLPTNICFKLYDMCAQQHAGDKDALTACRVNIRDECGTIDPAKASSGGSSGDDSSTTGSSTGSSAASTPSATTQGGDSSPTPSPSNGMAAPTMAAGQGLAAAAAAAGVLAYLI